MKKTQITKPMKIEIILIGIGLVFGMVGMIWFMDMFNENYNPDKINRCAASPYNIYSNNTRGYTYLFGKCYVEVTEYYQTKEKCGFLGISCYEASESHWEGYTYEICFNYKTGERC